ncbi:MAG: SDR family NAD(P)-dependent oxidoreductase [bacterium]
MSKIILITGSTDGIGKLAALKLAKEGHQIYLHGRNSNKLAQVIDEIKEASGNQKINGFVADFSDLAAVKAMAEEVKSSLLKIDILINNAGVFKSTIEKNNDGLDIRFAVNYFAPYVLTNELVSLLEKGENPRVVNLSSAAQSSVKIGALNGEANVNDSEVYAQSKLALTMWSFDFAKTNKSIVTIAVNPGSLLNTRMVAEAYGQHWAPADKGANILYELALSDEYDGISGVYFDNDKGNPKGTFGKAHPDAYSQEKMDWLIAQTDLILKGIKKAS